MTPQKSTSRAVLAVQCAGVALHGDALLSGIARCAVNFLKSYLAVALQGAVLYLVIGFYPALAASLGSGGSITEQAWAMLGQSVILLVAVFMSGNFTKAITNAVG